MPRYDQASHRVWFGLSHLTYIRGDVASRILGVPTRKLTRFLIHYNRQDVPANWVATTPGASSRPHPAYVADLEAFLEKSLDALLAIRTAGGSPLFTPKLPIEVYVEDTGSASGASPIGGPASVSNRLKDANEMATTAAHELVHVLQGQYYIDSWLPRIPVGGERRNIPVTSTNLLDEGLGVLPKWNNRWFVDAVADLYAGRAFHRGADFWVNSNYRDYLDVSLYANVQGSYYAVAHFLDWLESEVKSPVVATAMTLHDLSDFRGLNSAVGRANGHLGELFKKYCRAMYVGKLAPSGFDRESRFERVLLTRDRLYQEKTVSRDPMSVAAVSIGPLNATSLDGQAGLLVLERGDGYHDFSEFTFDLSVREGEEYLEREDLAAGKLVRSKDGRHKAFRTVGDEKSARTLGGVNQVLVNVGDKTARATYRYWLLLAPTDIRMEKDTLHWNHNPRGFRQGVVAGYNIYLGNRRLNSDPVRRRFFKHPDLTSTADVTVTVVDRLGFEWPEPPAAVAPAGAMVFRGTRTDAVPVPDGRRGTSRAEMEVTITGTAVEGRFAIRVDSPTGGSHVGHRVLKGSFEPKSGRLSGTITGKEQVLWGGKVTYVFRHAGTFSGAVKGEDLEVNYESRAQGAPSVSPLRGAFRARRVSRP
jgi:hypothetical protein